jgi:ABC-2 type transport system ATP-binding protein
MAEATGDEQKPPAKARPAAKRAPQKTAAAGTASSTRTPRTRSTTAKPRTPKAASARATAAKAPAATPEETAPAVQSTAAPEAAAAAEAPAQQAPAPQPPAPEEPAAATPVPQETVPAGAPDTRPTVLSLHGLRKRYGDTIAVDDVSLDIKEGSFYGIVGPNGAGKTTTLSIATGLLRPDEGRVVVHGVDAWAEPVRAKHVIGVLPDKLRLFDRLTGAQFLHYAGTLRGLNAKTVRARTADLAAAFGIEDALDRLVADYSAGMTKKIALAAAMIHSPRLLVLDEPFESVDPVSAANVVDILQRYTAAGGTVVVSSHGMDMIQRVCDSVAIIVRGKVLASGTIDQVRGEQTLEERFVELAGGRKAAEGMEWLHSFSD